MLNLVQHLVNMLSHIKSLFLPSAEALFIPVHRTGFSSAAFNKSEEDDDFCPGVQMVNGALGVAVVIQKGMLHQLAFLSIIRTVLKS
jgi:hypothetical protein